MFIDVASFAILKFLNKIYYSVRRQINFLQERRKNRPLFLYTLYPRFLMEKPARKTHDQEKKQKRWDAKYFESVN